MPKELEEDISPEEATALGLTTEEEDVSPEEAASLGLSENAPLRTQAPINEVDTSKVNVAAKKRGPPTTAGQALGRAAVQGASGGVSDEAAGVVDSYLAYLQKLNNKREDYKSETPSFSQWWADVSKIHKKLPDDYRAARDADRQHNRDATEDHPFIYGPTQVVTNLPMAIATGSLSKAAPALYGAGTALANSDAELTLDKISLESAGDAATSVALGGGLGKFAAKYPNAAKYLLPTMGAGMAAFGDKLGMSTSDRAAAATGTALAVPGLVADALENQAAKFGAKAGPPTHQVLDDVTAQHETNKTKAIGNVRKEEDTNFRATQAEQKKTASLDNLDGRIAQTQADAEGATLRSAGKDYSNRTKSANRSYLQRLGEMDDEVKALETVRARKDRELGRFEKALADVGEARQKLNQSVQGHEASSWKELYTRLAQYEQITGEPLPERFMPLKAKAADMYRKTSNNVIVDPEESAQAYRALKEFELDAQERIAKEAFNAFKSNGFDEEQAVRDLLKQKGSRVSKNEAYQLAQKLGLNPGDFETFEPIPPKGGFQLTEAPPPEAPPAPDRFARKLEGLTTRREQLTAPKPEPVRKPEADILAEMGLDKYSPQVETDAIVDRAANRVGESIKWDAAKGALAGAGVGAGGVQQNIPILKDMGPVGGALVGGVFGARHAIRTLTSIDDTTGKFKDPAGAAGVYRAIERILNRVPALGKKYGAGFQKGLSSIQLAFAIKHDPELARALDAESEENR